MGITIHYNTEFRGGKKALMAKLNEISDFARILGFKKTGTIYEVDYATDFNTRDKYTPLVKNEETGKMEIDGSYQWAKIQAEPRTGYIDGNESFEVQMKQREAIDKILNQMHKKNGFILSLWWGDGCEATNLCFIRTGKGKIWKGNSFTKTQYAKKFIEAHTSVCTLLKAAEKLGLINEVSDEGDYYETGDITQLTDASEENLKLIEAMMGKLTKRFGDNVQGEGLNATKILKDY